ncbi:hypothetical protein B0H16DRAFT_1550599 [Mycena metata]|uniref:Golgi apparatus membrane protein TVP38 n=1 Tax=Mycena metata TaxID=1033252 RepID=A0AAD7IUA6_9AGAR|nr:hypothetical protein B0H16DRAFT_1550599 [Mycena metata]
MPDSTFTPPSYAPTPNYAQNYAYTPTHNPQNSVSLSTLHDDSHDDPSKTFDDDEPMIPRTFSRTPSPTPSEFNALNGIKEKRTPIQMIVRYTIIAILLAVTIVISIEHEKIINALAPATRWLASHTAGPFIVIALLIILTFPPLFGGEIVATVAALAWSLPVAFCIVAAGTLLGEFANFFTFKYMCTARGEKMERSNLSYGLLAHVVRKGGFLVVLVVRYSAIPPHFATTVFATVGMSFWVFAGAAILSLPKTFVAVYIGYALRPENENNSQSQKIERIILIISVIITIGAVIWLRREEQAAKPAFIYARRKARQGKFLAENQTAGPVV